MSWPMRVWRYLPLLLVLFVTPSGAEDPTYLQACLEAAGGQTSEARATCFGQVSEVCLSGSSGTTADVTMCAEVELEAWAALLGETLATLRSAETPERVAAIDAAETAWLAWRDARCSIYTTFDATIAPPLAMICLAETTARWVDDLWAIERGFNGEAPL